MARLDLQTAGRRQVDLPERDVVARRSAARGADRSAVTTQATTG